VKRLYVVVRADLSPGLQCAQACHAAFEYGRNGAEQVGDNLVVLSASPERLLALAHAAALEEWSHVTFHEPDIGGELTAIALPGTPEVMVILRHLPLALRDRQKLSALTV
jgi:hypothetical protein